MGEPKPLDSVSAAGSDSEKAPTGTINEFWHIFTYADVLDRVLYAVAVLASIATGVAMPLMTVVFGRFTTIFTDFSSGAISGSEFQAEVNAFVLYFVYLFVAKMVLGYVSALAITIAGMRTTRAIRKSFIDHLLRMHIGFFDLPQSGSPASQVTTSTNRINQGVSDKLATMIQSIAGFFSSFVVALIVQWKLSLIVLSAIPAILLLLGFCIWVDANQELVVTNIYSEASVVALEAISTIRTVQAFWSQAKLAQKYSKLLENAHKQGNKKSLNYGVMSSSEYFIIYSAMALAFWQGHRMFLSGEIPNAGKVFTVVLSLMIASTSLGSLLPHLTTVTNAAAAASELFSIMRKQSLVDPLDESGKKPADCIGDIQFSSVNFAYPTRPTKQVLSDFSISVPAGKTTALVGASGCGKSTLIGLLEKWYMPESGRITLDGNELRDINTKWLRSHVRLVQQEPVLFQGTIFENVALGFVNGQNHLPYREQLTLVEEACKLSNAHDFIQQLSEGYQTQVGERAGMLSGGQKQRITIARSIISNPKVLLLDEATSALDPNAEKAVQDALNKVSKNRTTITIAHRLSTIKSADNIVVMGSGRVIEQGSHSELIALDSQYADLVRAQQLGSSPDSTFDDDETAVSGSNHQSLSLAMTTSAPRSVAPGTTVDYNQRESLDFSLMRCLITAIGEQKDLYPWVLLCVLASIMAAGTFPAQAILFSRVLGSFVAVPGQRPMTFWALMFFIVALGNFVAYFTIGFCCNQIAQTITRRYRQEMFERVISFDMAFFDLPHNSSGALASKLSSIPATLQELLSVNIFVLLILLLNIIFCAGMALGYGWKLALVVIFGGMTPIVCAGYIRIRVETKLDEDNAARFSESAGIASEAVGSIRTVASLAIEGKFLNKYDNMLSSIVTDSVKTLSFTMFPYSIAQSLEFLAMALGFWYGARLLSTGAYDTNQFFVIFLGVLFSSQAAAQFFGFTSSFTRAQSAANYFFWLRSIQPTIRESKMNSGEGPGSDADLNFTAVQFAYPQRPTLKILKGISFQVEAGKSMAFVGPSGCGKSTMISLIERFYDPISGSIKFGGKNITEMSPRLYRGMISLVQQEPVLYQGSVRDNIAMGLETEPLQAEIEAACSQANALDFILSLPEGFNTPCGSRGMQFSGGQRQRIAIARALIRSPRLLLLDEATSALDAQSEKVVQEALAQASAAAGRTTIAVAHRLATIRNYDVILVFDNGRIVEMGNHDELRAFRGKYHQMCLAQALDG